MHRSGIVNHFQTDKSVRAVIANALKTNATVTDVKFLGDCDESFCNTLAAVLVSNSTLQNLLGKEFDTQQSYCQHLRRVRG
jgi:hypothetical protein